MMKEFIVILLFNIIFIFTMTLIITKIILIKLKNDRVNKIKNYTYDVK